METLRFLITIQNQTQSKRPSQQQQQLLLSLSLLRFIFNRFQQFLFVVFRYFLLFTRIFVCAFVHLTWACVQRPYKSGCVPAGVGEGGEGRVAAKGLTLDRKYVCPPVRMSLCLSASASGQAGAPLCFALPASVSVSALLLLLLLLPFLYFIRFIFSASSRSRANEIREGASTHTHTKIFDCVCLHFYFHCAWRGLQRRTLHMFGSCP